MYTRIYVNGDADVLTVVDIIASATSGTIDWSTVIGMNCNIHVEQSDDFSPQALSVDPSDFIHFPINVEVESINTDMTLAGYLSVVSTVMESLARSGMQVVAACEWEDQLPGGGRIGI